MGIYLSVDFFQRVDIMLESNLPLHDIYTFFVCQIPMILTRGIPMATIISAIIALGLLKRNRELIAMETAGINPSYFVAPIVIAGLLLSVIHFGVAEFMARPLKQKLDETWLVNVRHWKAAPWMDMENMWFREENTIYQIRLYDRAKNIMQIASIFFLDANFRLIQRMDARRINWTDPGWLAEDGLIVTFRDGNTDQQWFERKAARFESYAMLISRRAKPFPTISASQDLHRYVEKIEGEGFSATPYRVDLHMRIASPLATFILALLGIIVALRQGIHEGIASGVGISLAVAFSFYRRIKRGQLACLRRALCRPFWVCGPET